MSLITIPSWYEAELLIEKERRLVRMLLSWELIEAPPMPFTVSLDWGYRCFVYPPAESTDEQLHHFLAWFVRRSGKKFLRTMRDSGSIFWWNNGHAHFTFEGVNLEALFLLEHFKSGNCTIIEEEKMVKVKRLVCNDGAEVAL
jgi:hypothetical protein